MSSGPKRFSKISITVYRRGANGAADYRLHESRKIQLNSLWSNKHVVKILYWIKQYSEKLKL